MSRLKTLILIELVLLALVGGVVWYLYFAPQSASVALSPPAAQEGALRPEAQTSEPLPDGAGALKGAGQKYPVPSGLDVMIWDRIEDEDGVIRYRFLAPGIAEGSRGEETADDMQVLCDTYVLANFPDPAHPPAQVIVTMMEKPIELGESRPDVVQFFEAFTIEDGICVWEMF